jgi:hypothetical protein
VTDALDDSVRAFAGEGTGFSASNIQDAGIDVLQ